jgi:adenosine deaminase CECR1
MPKGGLLHAHLDATVNAATLLKLALQQPAIHVRTKNTLNISTIASTLPEFRALSPDLFSDAFSLTDGSYVPNTWVSIKRSRENFAASLGGPEGFDKWVLNAMMINPSEAYGTHNTITKVCRYLYYISGLTDFFRSGKSSRALLKSLT